MRYVLFAVAVVMVLGACQQKKTITPERYTNPRGTQQTNQPPLQEPVLANKNPKAPSTVRESDVPPPPEPKRVPREPVASAPPRSQPAAPAPPRNQPGPRTSSTGEEVTYQIGAFSRPENAMDLASRAREAGFSAVVEDDATSGIASHRVIVTYPGSDSEARSRLLKLGVYDPILLGGRVGDASRQQPHKQPQPSQPSQPSQQSWQQQPPGGGVSYQVGAFSEVENANQIKRQLEEDGFFVVLEETSDPATRYRVLATWPGTDEEARARLLEHDIFDPIIVGAGPQASSNQSIRPAAVPAEPAPAQQTAAAPQKPAPRPAPDASRQQPPAPPVQPARPGPAPGPAPEQVRQPQGQDTFRFQVGAFSSIANAESMREKLKRAGFESELELIEEQGAPKYRVLAIKQGSVPALRQELMRLGVRDPLLLGY